MVKFLLSCIVCVFTVTHAYGYESYLRNYSINDGLPSSEVYAIYQDSKGFIWIGTDMGVGRYDGYTFKNFTTEDGLVDNTVFSITEDSKGRIWFSSFTGKICYFLNDTIYGRNFPVNDKLVAYLGSGNLNGIKEYADDTLLLATTKGMLKILPARLKDNRLAWDSIEVINTQKCYFIEGGYLTARANTEYTSHIGLYRGFKKVKEIDIQGKYNGIVHVDGNIDGSIQVYYTTYSYLLAIDANTIKSDSVKAANSSLFISDSIVWIGAERRGAKLYSLTDGLGKAQKSLLNGLTVSHILRDSEGGYWFATTEEGIFYMPSDKFIHYTTTEKEIPAERITGLTGTTDGLWITAGKQILQVKNKELPVPIYNHFLERLPNSQYFWNVYAYSPNEIWVCTNGGIAIVDPIKLGIKKIIAKYNRADGMYHASQQIIIDDAGYVWSLNIISLTKIDAGKKKILKIIPIPSRAQAICQDYNGNILIGTLNGMYAYSNDTLLYLGSRDPIYKNRFVDIKRYNGLVVAATRGAGLFLLSRDSIWQLTMSDGLSSNMCRTICIDGDSVIWVATNKGLNEVKIKTNPIETDIRFITAADGLLSNDIERVVKYKGNLWLYTKKGLTVFDPNAVAKNNVPPPIYITGFAIDNKPRPISDLHELSYSVNFIRIDFVGLTYKTSGVKRYKYKLVGYDDKWVYTNTTFAQFTKLPPGDYKFVVSCINNAGVESTQPATFSFTVNTPFYMQWWFFVLLTATIVIVLSSLYVYNINRIRIREKNKTEVNRRISQLELQALQSQMNPHFIFNCLNAIQDFIIKNDTQSATHYLNRFAKLIRITLNNSRKHSVILSEEINFLNLYMELEQMRYVGKFDYSINVSGYVRADTMEIPSMIIQPFIENAIRHGQIANMPEKGNVSVSFLMQEDVLVCSVDDNGVGINKSNQGKNLSEPRQAHALDIIKERIKTINDSGRFVISYSIVDKSDADINDSGTHVEISIDPKK